MFRPLPSMSTDHNTHIVPEWASLARRPAPSFLTNGKFGIYAHWGVYSVPAYGPNATWYPYFMYRPWNVQYAHHQETYGGAAKHGYKDFIPRFTGEKFDAEAWADLFLRAGAKYAGLVGEHHDGFSMWDSTINPWNSVLMGPRRDVVGELTKALRCAGLRTMISMHHAEHWFFYPHWDEQTDAGDPLFDGLYGERHNLDWRDAMPTIQDKKQEFALQDQPSEAFLTQWLMKTKEIVERYSPDLLWFDTGLSRIHERTKREMLWMFYQKAEAEGREAGVFYKRHDLPVGCGIVDLELGRMQDIQYFDWITDTTIDDGEGWGYVEGASYRSSESLLHYLIDNVSKNGGLLLSVGPKPDGTFEDAVTQVLLEIGAWLSINGEAIYGTQPWSCFGEGPTSFSASGMKSERKQRVAFVPGDVRYTTKGDVLYAILLGWLEENRIELAALSALYPGEVASVEMLGSGQPVLWQQHRGGLSVTLPDERPCHAAYVLKITRGGKANAEHL